MKPTISIRYLTMIVYLEDKRWLFGENYDTYRNLQYSLWSLRHVFEVEEDAVEDDPALWIKVDADCDSEGIIEEIKQLIEKEASKLVAEEGNNGNMDSR